MVGSISFILLVSLLTQQSVGVQGRRLSEDNEATLELRSSSQDQGRWKHRFWYRPSQKSATGSELVVETVAERIEHVQILSKLTASVIGRDEFRQPVLIVLDLERGTADLQVSCGALQSDTDNSSYLCLPHAGSESPVRVSIETRQIETVVPRAMDILTFLRSALLEDRIAAAHAVMKVQELVEDANVRNSLLSELTWAVSRDRAEAAVVRMNGVRLGTPLRDYLGVLAHFQGFARDLRALPALAAADHLSAVGALVAFGESAIPEVLRRFSESRPIGYSDLYLPKLCETLRLIAARTRLGPGLRQRIADAAVQILGSSATAALLREAMLLGEELDLNEVDPFVERFASDESYTQSIGIQAPQDIALIRETAIAILSRRASIRLMG